MNFKFAIYFLSVRTEAHADSLSSILSWRWVIGSKARSVD